MPIVWHLESSVITITDADGDFCEAISDVLSNPRVKEGMPLLVDRRDASDRVFLAELHSRARWISTFLSRNASARCALVARRRPHSHYGLARTIAACLEFDGVDAEVFTDINEAERWLSDTCDTGMNCASPGPL
jgi:hypothetical protein